MTVLIRCSCTTTRRRARTATSIRPSPSRWLAPDCSVPRVRDAPGPLRWGLAPTSYARRGGAFVNCISVTGHRRAARLASCSTPALRGLDHWHWRTTATTIVATPLDFTTPAHACFVLRATRQNCSRRISSAIHRYSLEKTVAVGAPFRCAARRAKKPRAQLLRSCNTEHFSAAATAKLQRS